VSVILVEGVSDRVALEAVAVKLGRDLERESVTIVPIGGAQAVARAAQTHAGSSIAGLCDAPEERWFRRALGDAVYVCRENLEDELIRALGPERVEAAILEQGDLETFRTFQNQPAWRGRPHDAQLRRWLHAADRRNSRYPPLLVAALDPVEIPAPLAGVLASAAR
jgi:Overcoming lysogenization defect protein-like, TOPRIM domain